MKRGLLTACAVAAMTNASIAGASAADTFALKLFGHEVTVAQGKDAANRLAADGAVLLEDQYVSIGEIAIVAGVPVMLGESGPGGNACEPSRFIIGFPPGTKPRLYGPLDTCSGTSYRIGPDRIVVEAPSMPGHDGKTWTWTPSAGFSPAKTAAFAPSGKDGWSALRSHSIDHPLGLLKYADLAKAIASALPDRLKGALARIASGPGSLTYHGNIAVGFSCQAHSCDDTAMVVALDIDARKAYVAMKDTGRPAAIDPPLRQWPAAAGDEISDFRGKFLR